MFLLRFLEIICKTSDSFHARPFVYTHLGGIGRFYSIAINLTEEDFRNYLIRGYIGSIVAPW